MVADACVTVKDGVFVEGIMLVFMIGGDMLYVSHINFLSHFISTCTKSLSTTTKKIAY